MINQDDVFVIGEEDILKPTEGSKKRASSGSVSSGSPRSKPTMGGGKEARETAFMSTAATRPGARTTNPAIASSLSLCVWGLGQLYNGDRKLGVLFFLWEIQLLAFHYLMYMAWDQIRYFSHIFFLSEWELVLYVSSVDFCMIFLVIFNVAQAYRHAEATGRIFEGFHSPIAAGVASAVIPGWGQLLNGQLGKAVLFLFVFFMQIYLVGLYLFSPLYRVVLQLDQTENSLRQVIWVGMGTLFAAALFWLISTYDAILVARYTRRLAN